MADTSDLLGDVSILIFPHMKPILIIAREHMSRLIVSNKLLNLHSSYIPRGWDFEQFREVKDFEEVNFQVVNNPNEIVQSR